MYIGTIDGKQSEVFNSVSELVEHYNRNHKGDNYVEVYEALEDSFGCAYLGEFMFGFHKENYGDIR